MNSLKDIWREFPPWLKTFLLGLALAIAAPTLTALESVDTATDWRVWFGGLTAAVGLSVAHYVKDRLGFTLAAALGGGGAGLVVAAYLLGATTGGPALQHGAGVDPPLVDTGVSLPRAPTSPDGVTLCPKGWASTPGTIPPDAVLQLPSTHVGARSFYTCSKPGFEVTIFDNGFISGYEGSNPLTPEQARRALTR